MRSARAALVLAGALAAPPVQACVPSLAGESVRLMRSTAHAVAWRAEPPVIVVGRLFTVELAVCSTSTAIDSVAIDAEMPAHRHGMNYRASLVALGNGRYRAEGLMFHMPGHWRVTVELRAGATVERLSDDVTIE
jgi:hypothetical protein